MVIVVDDIRERISLCGMTAAQFFQLAALIRLAHESRHGHISMVATALHASPHWILTKRPRWPVTVTLAHLTWEEVFVLQAYIAECAGCIEGDAYLTAQILDGLDAAVESSLRTDTHAPHSRF